MLRQRKQTSNCDPWIVLDRHLFGFGARKMRGLVWSRTARHDGWSLTYHLSYRWNTLLRTRHDSTLWSIGEQRLVCRLPG
jgi:hypothetical protein